MFIQNIISNKLDLNWSTLFSYNILNALYPENDTQTSQTYHKRNLSLHKQNLTTKF